MLGSSQSVASPNIVLNTIMAEALRQFADTLENAGDFDQALHELVRKSLTDHQRIIFDGNGYSQEWKDEAARRGLSNYPSTAEALAHYISDKNIRLVTNHGIFTENEFRARHAIHMDAYVKTVNIEGRTMVDMALHQILPAAVRYSRDLCDTIRSKDTLGVSHRAESAVLSQLSQATDGLYEDINRLRDALDAVPSAPDSACAYCHDSIVPAMNALRANADTLEQLTDKSYWPYPTYSDLLFY